MTESRSLYTTRTIRSSKYPQAARDLRNSQTQRTKKKELTEFPEEHLDKYKQPRYRRRRRPRLTHAGAPTRELPLQTRDNVAGKIPPDPASLSL